jgi:hypothetical protein
MVCLPSEIFFAAISGVLSPPPQQRYLFVPLDINPTETWSPYLQTRIVNNTHSPHLLSTVSLLLDKHRLYIITTWHS